VMLARCVRTCQLALPPFHTRSLCQVTRCLKRLARSTPEAIATKFGYPNEVMAAAVQQRAKDLLHRGFEWTLQYGWPQNPDPVR
jgi:hypothetical protein